jgi:chemotaxis protein methyltransferase CheR
MKMTDALAEKGAAGLIASQVVPFLRTFPSARVWCAGPMPPAEVAAVALLLEREGLIGKARVYCTDREEAGLEAAREALPERWRPRVLFFGHNPLTDSSFNEFQAVICRWTLNDLASSDQERVLRLFWDSLCPLGLLVLKAGDGAPETLGFERMPGHLSLYRRAR